MDSIDYLTSCKIATGTWYKQNYKYWYLYCIPTLEKRILLIHSSKKNSMTSSFKTILWMIQNDFFPKYLIMVTLWANRSPLLLGEVAKGKFSDTLLFIPSLVNHQLILSIWFVKLIAINTNLAQWIVRIKKEKVSQKTKNEGKWL